MTTKVLVMMMLVVLVSVASSSAVEIKQDVVGEGEMLLESNIPGEGGERTYGDGEITIDKIISVAESGSLEKMNSSVNFDGTYGSWSVWSEIGVGYFFRVDNASKISAEANITTLKRPTDNLQDWTGASWINKTFKTLGFDQGGSTRVYLNATGRVREEIIGSGKNDRPVVISRLSGDGWFYINNSVEG